MSGAGARCRDLCRGNSFRVITSDVCNVIAMVLLIISVAVGTHNPTDNFSWAKCELPFPDGSDSFKVNFGLQNYVTCLDGDCVTKGLGSIENSHCKVGGDGVITAAAFAMLFGLLSIFFLHVEANGKTVFGRAVRFPRLFLALFSFLSLVLYIVVVATWYNQCFNGIDGYTMTLSVGSRSYTFTATSVKIGYAVATAIAAIVFSFLAWSFAFWRTCSPNKNEPAPQPKVKKAKVELDAVNGGAVVAGSPMSPGGSTVPYTQQASSSNLGQTVGEEEGGAYGGSSGGYGGSYGSAPAANESYSNESSAGGYTSGGYGGGGGAYGGSSGGGAYGGNDSGGAYGGSSGGGAYGNGNKQESAYGY